MKYGLTACALALLFAGCTRNSDNRSAPEADQATVNNQGDEPVPAPEEHKDDVAAPPVQTQGGDVSTNKNISIKGLAGVEHAQGGSFAAYDPTRPVPTPIKEGDRLHLRLEVADDAWVYAVGAFRQGEYWKIGEWGPGAGAANGIRTPWPEGHILSKDEARMTTMFVIASAAELDWAKNLAKEDCSALVGQMPPEPAKSACDHLYGLFWKVPGRARGRTPPPVEYFRTKQGTNLPAIVASHSGTPYTAVEWLFKPRN